MTDTKYAANLAAKWMRWTARGIGLYAAGWAGMWTWVRVLLSPVKSFPTSLPVYLFGDEMMFWSFIATLLGVAVAWWRERIGGTILLVAAVALILHGSFLYSFEGEGWSVSIFSMFVRQTPSLMAGILFLASWRIRKIAHL